MRYYPVSLDLAGRDCIVVGGGTIAEGKVAPLVAAGARVTVVAPVLSTALSVQHRAGRFTHVAREYRRGDLATAFLVIAATADAEVNHAVHAEAVAAGALINVVDDPPYCGFILPSVMRRGDLTVASLDAPKTEAALPQSNGLATSDDAKLKDAPVAPLTTAEVPALQKPEAAPKDAEIATEEATRDADQLAMTAPTPAPMEKGRSLGVVAPPMTANATMSGGGLAPLKRTRVPR